MPPATLCQAVYRPWGLHRGKWIPIVVEALRRTRRKAEELPRAPDHHQSRDHYSKERELQSFDELVVMGQ